MSEAPHLSRAVFSERALGVVPITVYRHVGRGAGGGGGGQGGAKKHPHHQPRGRMPKIPKGHHRALALDDHTTNTTVSTSAAQSLSSPYAPPVINISVHSRHGDRTQEYLQSHGSDSSALTTMISAIEVALARCELSAWHVNVHSEPPALDFSWQPAPKGTAPSYHV